MIYLDYSATTPVDKRVLDSYVRVNLDYVGNANSIHSLGLKSHELMDDAVKQVAELVGVKKNEIIFTSGATESNNMVLKGVSEKLKNRGKHIISTKLEHASISKTLDYLEREGFEVSYLELDKKGKVKISSLKELLRDDTILVTVAAVNSEIGIRQPIEEIAEVLKGYPAYFHVDATQAIGKIPFSFDNIDLVSFTSHKFYGLKGIGCLVKKEDVPMVPLFHGGESQSVYRAGTPALPLIVSFAKALRLALENLDSNYEKVVLASKKLREGLKEFSSIAINSDEECIPHILNLSLIDIKPETFVHALAEADIYISTKTACSSKDELSKSLLALGKNRDEVLTSIRISISHLTSVSEIDIFLEKFEENYNKLRM